MADPSKRLDTKSIIERLRASKPGGPGPQPAAPPAGPDAGAVGPAAATAGLEPVAAAAVPPEPGAAEPAGSAAADATPPAAAKPRDTKSILEAARRGKTAAAAGETAPAAAKPRDTKSILEAARRAKAGAPGAATVAAKPAVAEVRTPAAMARAEPAAPAVTARPPASAARLAAKPAAAAVAERPKPARPAPAKAKATTEERRQFFLFTWIGAAWTCFTVASLAATAGMVRFMFPNVLAEPPHEINVGPINQFDPGTVSERWKADYGFWICRSVYEGQDIVYAIQAICTHLGCPPNWLASEQKFKCPCHGSGYYISGVNFEGPAPRPMERFRIQLVEGSVVVDKSKTYHQELGQWTDPESYIAVT